jgi:hypothetical protein
MITHRAKILVLVGLLLTLLAGCVSSIPFQKASVEQGKALIYVFRPESVFARGEMFKLEVNGSPQGMLLNNAYLPLQVDPGEATLKVLQNSPVPKPPLASLKLTAQAGGAYYVKVKPGIAWTVEMLQLDREQGAKEIGSTVFYQTR